MKEALRYLHNAREILKRAPWEGSIYTDIKPVRESFSTAYLSILLAIDEYLLSRGLTKKELPKSFEQYQKALRKYISVHNGKLFREFDRLYEALHIAGYYRGNISHITVVRDYLNATRQFIEKLSK